MALKIESTLSDLALVAPLRRLGRVSEARADRLLVSGLTGAALGDRVVIPGLAGGLSAEGDDIPSGEIIAFSQEGAVVLPEGSLRGIRPGDPVELTGPLRIAPGPQWLGRIIDPQGRPLDGRPLISGGRQITAEARAPAAAQRRGLGARLSTGVAVFDTALPLVRGQRIGLFAGSGVGKSSLLGEFARHVSADVVVIALVGERGRELRDFTTKILGEAGLARSVVVTATSDQSALLRRRCLPTAMAIAEFYRDEGKHVLLLVDSVTRFAEAHREIALAAGEPASMRGYPPSTMPALMSLCERAGPGLQGSPLQTGGDITAIFSVLVAGSDLEGPIADILRGTIDGHVVLSREIAERGRYPAVDLLQSVSRSLPEAANGAENEMIAALRRLLAAYDRAEMMIQSGLYQNGSDPLIDRALQLWPGLDGFLAEPAPPGGNEASFALLRQRLAGQQMG